MKLLSRGLILILIMLGLVTSPKLLAFQVDDNPSLISAIAYSPDGTRMAIGGGETGCASEPQQSFAIVIIDTETLQVLARYLGHKCRIVSLAWSPDGTRLASGGVDGSKVWDAVTDSLISSSDLELGRYSLAWSSDSTQYLSVIGEQPTVEVLDAESGATLKYIVSQHGFIYAADWSPTQQQIITGNTSIELWDLQNGQVIRSSIESSSIIRAIEWSPTGLLIESVSGNSVSILDSQTLNEVNSLTINDPSSVSWSNTGNGIAVGSYNGSVSIWSTETFSLLSTITGNIGAVLDVDWSPLGDEVAYVGNYTGNNGENLAFVPVPSVLLITPTPTDMLTSTPSYTPTDTPAPTATATPTDTPAPTASAAPPRRRSAPCRG